MTSLYRFVPFLFALALAVLMPAQTTLAVGERAGYFAQGDDSWASLQTDGWAIVDRVIGPEVVQVRLPSGERFRVWHVGVIGPTPNQDGGAWHQRATQTQVQLLPAGSKVWLEIQPGAGDPPKGQWVYRHVYREKMPDAPIGAELLRSGMTWVYPHASHPFVALYADEQASAISTRAGLWAETQSSDVFFPDGATYGGYPVNPRVVPILQSLEASPMGREVLAGVNDFPVEIGVAELPRGVLGVHMFRFYTIQLAQGIMDAPADSVAAVLLHELTHARQMINAGVLDVDMGCYEMEIEAFEVTARYWASLHGPNGKRRPAHWLDNTLNENLRDYNNQRLAQNVRRAYGHECGAAFRDTLESSSLSFQSVFSVR
ncbi:MAG: hypothetical protein ACKVVP_05105 [Chloroflexota bacterium]